MKEGGDFKEKTGVTPLQARTLAGLSAEFKGELISQPLANFFNSKSWTPYVERHKKTSGICIPCCQLVFTSAFNESSADLFFNVNDAQSFQNKS